MVHHKPIQIRQLFIPTLIHLPQQRHQLPVYLTNETAYPNLITYLLLQQLSVSQVPIVSAYPHSQTLKPITILLLIVQLHHPSYHLIHVNHTLNFINSWMQFDHLKQITILPVLHSPSSFLLPHFRHAMQMKYIGQDILCLGLWLYDHTVLCISPFL